MFNFFKRELKQMSDKEYQAEFLRLIREVESQFSIGDSPREQLLYAMGVIEKEMNWNGGCNWIEENFAEYLDTIRNTLISEKQFSSEQLEKIKWSLDEIIECGKELESQGESSRDATSATDYLVSRVVDWCQINDTV